MTSNTLQCPSCGAEGVSGKPCWLCSRELSVMAEAVTVNPYAPPAVAGSSASYSLASLMLIVTLIAVSLALATAAPGFGIPLAIVVTPALIRTVVQVGRKRSLGSQVSTPQKVTVFLASLAGTVTACVTAGVAFFATCLAGCFGIAALDASSNLPSGDFVVWILFGLSGLVGLLCGGLVLRTLWRTRR